MKVLTAAQMREVDRRTIDAGIPGLILMENAGARVVEFLVEKFRPIEKQRIVVLCGKGNNGGDGFVVARQLHTRFHPASLDVALAGNPDELKGDAAANYRMLRGAGCDVGSEITSQMQRATVVVDALLGTGLQGGAHGQALDWIRQINAGFPDASVVAVDVPSGLESDSGRVNGEVVAADYTVTFTAPKICQVEDPAAERCGQLMVEQIGSPPELYEKDDAIFLSLSRPERFRHLLRPRVADSNKGLYGHVLVIAGARGKTGAAGMAGLAALHAGAGLSTVASAESAIPVIAGYAPELMTEPLPETETGSISLRAIDGGTLGKAAEKKTVAAMGPGMGQDPDTVKFIRRAVAELKMPLVIDADALNALGDEDVRSEFPRILTPHPGEMSRLIGKPIKELQQDRVGTARAFAQDRGVYLVLKGNRTVIAMPNGHVAINPTGSPALATGGTGDVLTGMIAGFVAQFPEDIESAILAAVYLHGRSGELGAAKEGEKGFIATDIFRYLPEAMREAAGSAHTL